MRKIKKEKIHGMTVIRNPLIPFPGYKAILLFGVLFAKPNAKLDELTVNHESIHSKQYKELLTVGLVLFIIIQLIFNPIWYVSILLFLTIGLSLFYVLYVLEWILKGFKYHDISFEREAYIWQGYATNRKRFGWIRYLRLKKWDFSLTEQWDWQLTYCTFLNFTN